MVAKIASWALLALLLSCTPQEQARTELLLVADTDIGTLQEIEFTVTGPDGKTKRARGPSGARAPGARSLGLVYSEGELGPFMLSATGMSNDESIVARKAKVWFVKGKTLVVPLHLVSACIDVVCKSEEQQCTERGCRPLALRESDLAPWDGKVPGLSGSDDMDAGTTPPSDGGTSDASVLSDAGADASDSDARVDETPLPDGGIGMCQGQTTDLGNDDQHCGDCDTVCAVPSENLHATNRCSQGKCKPGCLEGFGNCDSKAETGCEVDLLNDDLNCGMCNKKCNGNRHCVEGVCIK